MEENEEEEREDDLKRMRRGLSRKSVVAAPAAL